MPAPPAANSLSVLAPPPVSVTSIGPLNPPTSSSSPSSPPSGSTSVSEEWIYQQPVGEQQQQQQQPPQQHVFSGGISQYEPNSPISQTAFQFGKYTISLLGPGYTTGPSLNEIFSLGAQQYKENRKIAIKMETLFSQGIEKDLNMICFIGRRPNTLWAITRSTTNNTQLLLLG